MTWHGLLRQAIRALEGAGLEDARRSAEWMAAEAFGCRRAHLFAYPERTATPEQAATLGEMVERRLQHEPLQYILGYADFYGLRLRVSPAVLIPRPETEHVVEIALGRLRDVAAPRVFDVGTGSGCIPLAIRHERPDATVYACDISDDALAVARANAEALGLAVSFFQADVLADDFASQAPGALDLLISNPPYIALDEADSLTPEVRAFEPHQALFAGDDPLRFYRAITHHAPQLLTPGGYLVFETHAYHAEAVATLVDNEGLTDMHLQRDLAGLPRIVYGRMEG